MRHRAVKGPRKRFGPYVSSPATPNVTGPDPQVHGLCELRAFSRLPAPGRVPAGPQVPVPPWSLPSWFGCLRVSHSESALSQDFELHRRLEGSRRGVWECPPSSHSESPVGAALPPSLPASPSRKAVVNQALPCLPGVIWRCLETLLVVALGGGGEQLLETGR